MVMPMEEDATTTTEEDATTTEEEEAPRARALARARLARALAPRRIGGRTTTTVGTEGGKVRATCGNANGNGGWNQGVMNAALLGNAEHAKAGLLGRSSSAPGAGYRFIGFAPHEQDYEPSGTSHHK